MKKLLSFVMSASLAVTSLSVTNVSAENEKIENMVIFGDSISTGYGLNHETEYTYGEICADYLGCNLSNYAVDGLCSDGLLEKIENLNDTERESVANADVVVISIGGNDIIKFTSATLLNYSAQNGFLYPQYTAADIPENPSVNDMLRMINFKGEGGIQQHMKDDNLFAFELISELSALSRNICLSSNNNVGVIPNGIIPNIQSVVNDIKEINPDTRIIVQTIYQPIQFSPSFILSEYGNSEYANLISILRPKFNGIMDSFRQQLSSVNGIETADVLYEFTSLDSIDNSTNDTPGYAWYFTDIQAPMVATQEGGKTKDIHPNQNGHLAIASVILDVIGVKNTSLDNLYMNIFRKLENNSEYPAIAYKDFLKNIDISLGDTTNDGLIDTVDASAILAEYAGAATNGKTFDDRTWTVSDLNHDNFVDAVDASIALAFYAWVSTGNTGHSIFDYMYMNETGLST